MNTKITSRTRALCSTLLCGIICIIATPAAVRAASLEQTATAFISSDLYVGADNTISVTEVIEIHQIEHYKSPAIIHRFGTVVRDNLGNAIKRHIIFHNVQIDGRAAAWTLTTLPDEIAELQIPIDQTQAAPGVRTYTLSYSVDNGIIFEEQSDLLYWEVTGSFWNIPIPWSRIVVHAPETLQAKNIRVQLRTGTPEKADLAAVFQAQGSALTGITNRTLAPGESFSVLLTLPKGHVAEPDWIAKMWWILQDNRNLVVHLGTISILFAYYWLAWFFFGRDPQPKTIIPQYEPPHGLSPAALAYILSMRVERRGLAAAFLSLAQRGYISIAARESDYTLTRTSKLVDKATPPEETALLLGLFATAGATPISTADPVLIPNAHRTITNSLKTQFGKRYFRYNTGIILLGLGMSLLMGRLLEYYPVPPYGVGAWIILLAAINVGFGLAIPTRTEAGKRLLEQIYGFRDFLKTTEQDRLNFHHSPGTRTRRLNIHLAYAVALGVPHTGTKEFIQSIELVSPFEQNSAHESYMRSHTTLDSDIWQTDLGKLLKRVSRRLRGRQQTSDTAPDQNQNVR